MSELTHVDANGNAIMVDISEKEGTSREAVAVGRIHMNTECFQKVMQGQMKKGDVLSVAQVAGIMAVKRTSELIPLCHLLPLTNATVEFTPRPEVSEFEARCQVKCDGKTGVEMEALTGVTVALLTIYDMCKAVDKCMVIQGVHLVTKTGGKSGEFRYEE